MSSSRAKGLSQQRERNVVEIVQRISAIELEIIFDYQDKEHCEEKCLWIVSSDCKCVLVRSARCVSR